MSDLLTDSTATITVYSAPWCGFCKMAKGYLSSKGLTFKDVNIDEDRQALTYIYEKTGQAGIPVIEIGSEIILGFDREKIDLALRSNKMIG
jgi:glutaredoxin 3